MWALQCIGCAGQASLAGPDMRVARTCLRGLNGRSLKSLGVPQSTGHRAGLGPMLDLQRQLTVLEQQEVQWLSKRAYAGS